MYVFRESSDAGSGFIRRLLVTLLLLSALGGGVALLIGERAADHLEAVLVETAHHHQLVEAETLALILDQTMSAQKREMARLATELASRNTQDAAIIQPLIAPYRDRFRGLEEIVGMKLEDLLSVQVQRGEVPETAEKLKDVVLIIVGDANGRAITGDPAVIGGQPVAGTDYSDRDYFKEIKRTGRPAISRVQFGKRTGRLNVQLARPILGVDGGVTGFVSSSVSLEPFWQLGRRMVSRTQARAVVVDREGLVVLDTAAGPPVAARNLAEVSLFAAAAGSQELRRGKDDAGAEVDAAVLKLADGEASLGWTVIIAQPSASIREEAISARTRARWIALGLSAVGAALSLALAAWASHSVARIAARG
jgi:hypothetical protein